MFAGCLAPAEIEKNHCRRRNRFTRCGMAQEQSYDLFGYLFLGIAVSPLHRPGYSCSPRALRRPFLQAIENDLRYELAMLKISSPKAA